MKIKFLKAGKGDAILIHCNEYNILIDGGNDYTYVEQELNEIYNKGKHLDLVIVTHHDDDHIAGIINLANDINSNRYGSEKDFIKKIIFNSPKAIKNNLDSTYLSYDQANKLNNLLGSLNCEHIMGDSSSQTIILGDLSIDIIAPFKTELIKYAENSTAQLAGGKKCDWNNSLAELRSYCDDISLDTSPSNKTSIACIVSFNKKQILLPGDSTPDVLAIALQNWAKVKNVDKIKFDLVKLPHHGSYRNISKDLIELIDCNKYVIMTNGGNSYLPDKKTFCKILKINNHKHINFFFNYENVISSLNFLDEELKLFNFSLHKPNETNGYYYQ